MGRILHKDIIEQGNPFDEAEKGLKQMLDLIEKSTEETKELVVELQKVAKAGKSTEASDTKELLTLKNKLSALEKALAKNKQASAKVTKTLSTIEKERSNQIKTFNSIQAKNTIVQGNYNKAIQKGRLELQENNKNLKSSIQIGKAASGSIQKLRLETAQLVKDRDKLGDITGKNAKQFQSLTAQIARQEQKLVAYDKEIGRSQRLVGQYEKGLSKLKSLFVTGLGVFGLTAGIQGFTNAMKGAVTVFTDFTAQASKLQAITGETAKSTKVLTDQAKALGASTAKTASEVVALQIEYAKLGFNIQEIEAATEATLNLSIATGEGLADSAAVAGATLKGFGLEASQTQRVTDVMAASFSKSALDLSKFQESMKLVAPISNAAGISLETTTSLLGKLADAGLSGSIAGTGLKNVISKLSDENSALSQELGFSVKNSDDLSRAFEVLRDKNIDLTEATELTDERSKAAFLTLIKGSEDAKVLEGQLINSAGAAKRMADTMADNLKGDTDKANSAMEALGISIGENLEPALRKSTQAWTKFISRVNDFVRIKPSEELQREKAAMNNLVGAITSANNTQESRNRLIEELQREYPDFLGNLDAETATNEDLRVKLVEVNAEYQKKIDLLVQEELVAEARKELIELQIEELELVKKLNTAEAQLLESRGKTVIVGDQVINQQVLAQDRVDNLTESLDRNREAQDRRNISLQNDLDLLRKLQKEPISTGAADSLLGEFIEEKQKEVDFEKENNKILLDLDEQHFKDIQDSIRENIKLQEELRKVASEAKIDNILNDFEYELALTTANYQQQLSDLKINREELQAINNDADKEFTQTQQLQWDVLKELETKYNNDVKIIGNNRLLASKANEAAIFENAQEEATLRGEWDNDIWEERVEIENERFELELENLKGQQEAIEEATIEHYDNLNNLTKERTAEEEKAAQFAIDRDLYIADSKQNLLASSIGAAKQFSALNAAAFIAEKAMSISRIIQATAVANAQAPLFSPPTGLPWIAINTAAAAISIAAIVAQTAVQMQGFYDGGEYSGDGGYTGSGNAKSESKAVGKKPYNYHKEEFILNHGTYAKNKVTANMMHNGMISDSEIIPALEMAEKLDDFGVSVNTKYNNDDVVQMLSVTNQLLRKHKTVLQGDKYTILDIDGNEIRKI